MVSGIGGMRMYDQSSMTSRIFKQLDTNTDNSIDTTELQAFADSGANIDINQMMTDLDGNGDGSINTSEIDSALKKLGDEIQSRFANSGMQNMQPPDPAEMFKNADVNEDGSLDKSEFAAIGPGNVDEATLDEMFDSIDTDGNGSIDEAENETAMGKMGPPASGGMPPPPPEETSSTSETDTSALSAVLEAGSSKNSSIAQLLEALKSTDDDESDDPAVSSIKNLISELQNSMTYSSQANLSASMSSTKSLFSIIA